MKKLVLATLSVALVAGSALFAASQAKSTATPAPAKPAAEAKVSPASTAHESTEQKGEHKGEHKAKAGKKHRMMKKSAEQPK
ncbi:MAG: hypothetical protein RML15_05340 [Bacteroidota bacterium]|nr:hypothetical protein [Candidatus Kapabacteria bacterium]MCX7937357.1 hypothetical protein [Chlorobiota bacterium]MDW8075866.1 hypothetical protein [Bacteroidota bacterium]MDW8271814.1 hypothetical protein [Bacteroidota bacterium]